MSEALENLRPLRNDPIAVGLVLCCAVVAVLLGWMSVLVHTERACAVENSPYFLHCPETSAETPAGVQALRNRISRNPGDANAYTELALKDHGANHERVVNSALLLSPNQPYLLLHRAAAALDRMDWAAAVPILVQAVEYQDEPSAANVLARLIASGQGQLLERHLVPGTHWFTRVLSQVKSVPGAYSTALPLVVKALARGIIDEATVSRYVSDMKAGKAWTDAYSLWVAVQRKPVPLLNNGGFDEPLQSEGFDWEIPRQGPLQRAGAIAARKTGSERGGVLDIQFTGRPIALPIARQYLFIGPGRYRLRGEYLVRQFRSEQGMAWVAVCTSGQRAGTSSALGGVEVKWRSFEFEFTVPAGCGEVVALQLETPAPSQAVLGARGRMMFDALSLERLSM